MAQLGLVSRAGWAVHVKLAIRAWYDAACGQNLPQVQVVYVSQDSIPRGWVVMAASAYMSGGQARSPFVHNDKTLPLPFGWASLTCP